MPRFLAPIYVDTEYVTENETISGDETILGTTSGKDSYWDNVYAHNLLSGNEGLFTQNVTAYEFIGIGKQLTQVFGTDTTKLPLSGGRIDGNLVLNGSLTALSGATFVNTIFTTTSALSIINTGYGPALYVWQSPGTGDVASFVDGDGIEVLHVGNDGKVGIDTSNPNKELTVNGEISATSDIWANKFRGDGSQLTDVLGTDVSKLPLAGGTLYGHLAGTTATFTTSISSPSISGTFYGDLSNGLNVPHYFITARTATSIAGFMDTGAEPHLFMPNSTGRLTFDGVPLSAGNVVMLNGQSTTTENGPWYVFEPGGVGVIPLLQRPKFFTGKVKSGMMFTITKGTSLQGFVYVVNPSSSGVNDITVGTTPLTISKAYTRNNDNAVLFANTFSSTQTLAIGTATTAPLRFQAGALLTTPVQHSVEWDGNFMYLTTSGANSARTTNVAFVSAPATSSSYGLSRQVAYDSSFFYVCTAANTWLKTPLTINGIPAGIDETKLPLSGGVLTGPLTGTTGLFTTSLSSLNLSGTHYGDGSKLTGIASGLPLGGGTLTGGLTGTTGTFTTSISSPNISGTFYGDGGNLYNIPSQINFIFDGGGAAVQLNSTGIVQIPYNIKIVSWTLLANAQANAIVQVLTSSFATHPTYSVISGLHNTPTLINVSKAASTTMTGWITAIPADSYLQFTVTSNDTATNLTVSLKCLRTS